MSDWELVELSDWVELEATKHDLIPDPDSYPLDNYFLIRRTMNPKLNPMDIPVPPAPILERAVGYQNNRDARYLALWWELAGDEAMVSDGLVTFTGHWAGYLAYVHHKSVYTYLASYDLGTSDELAEYHLVFDLMERKAYIATSREADTLLSRQRRQESIQDESVLISMEDLQKLLQGFIEQIQAVPSLDEVKQRMEEDHQAVETLSHWLDGHTETEANGTGDSKRSRQWDDI